MENLIIVKTTSTPYISFDAVSGFLQIKGESFPENAAKFYTAILAWLTEHLNNTTEQITMEFEIIYFNSSTSKVFMSIFDMLDEEVKNGKEIVVNWRCDAENETAMECGEDFKEDLNYLPFNIIVV